jgi:hypothetical protein
VIEIDRVLDVLRTDTPLAPTAEAVAGLSAG